MTVHNAANTCPYKTVALRNFFSTPGSRDGNLGISPIADRLSMSSQSRVVSAGSCFAARIARVLRSKSSVQYVQFEDIAAEEKLRIRPEGAHEFSLRDGNIYTSRGLAQILSRALERDGRTPPWALDSAGRYRNLLRPSVVSYDSLESLQQDEKAHLHNWLLALRDATHFVFTLGLTEHWVDKETKLALQNAPGCGFGSFSPSKYYFENLSLRDVERDLTMIVEMLQAINPSIIFIITISPVPLVATYEPRSAYESTFYSKSLMRQAVANLVGGKEAGDNVVYFPSYEIITNPFVISRCFASNMRSITDFGVDLVMSQFFKVFGITQNDVTDCADIDLVFDMSANQQKTLESDPVCDEENIYAAVLQKSIKR